MSDITDTLMKFERLMGHTHEELMEIGRQPHQAPILNEKNSKTIGYYTINPKTGKIKYTLTKEYKKDINSK